MVEAQKVFQEMIKIEPFRTEGLDSYSTCLWRQKKQIELIHLSHSALSINLFAPETWVVVGNSYSLQNEHEAAIKFFKRAIQINPRYSLAYSNCGFEYIAIEDTKAAHSYFEKGLSIDNQKNYKIWWGIGLIKLKQEKFSEAQKHFRMAGKCNPSSAAVHTYLGISHKNLHEHREALKEFEIAENLNPENMHNTFHRANLLLTLNEDMKAEKLLTDLVK